MHHETLEDDGKYMYAVNHVHLQLVPYMTVEKFERIVTITIEITVSE